MTDRRMPKYHKIQSLFMRDQKGRFLRGQWALRELEYLANLEWEFTEKVDGTNIRIWVSPEEDDILIGGRTDRAQIPAPLVNAIHGMGLPARAVHLKGPVVLYGEGYGAKIQKGGGNYRPDQSFVLFDVWAPDDSSPYGGWWLDRQGVVAVAKVLDLDVVPLVGYGTLHDAIGLVDRPEGVRSEWGDFRSEGLVCRPVVPMFTRKGERIICKAKSKDFDRIRGL